jgi:chloramphenicol 3-O-phosphotransferase
LRVARAQRVGDGAGEPMPSAGLVDVVENRGFLRHLAAQRVRLVAVRAPVDEAHHREVGGEGEQRRQQRHPHRDRDPQRFQAEVSSL